MKDKKEKNVSLKVDGEKIPLNPFVRDFIEGTLTGMLTALRGCEDPREVEITIKKK